ncbi:hypothetical protein ACLOJK_031471 [Asimina triloba]
MWSTSSLLRVFSDFDCDDNDIVTANELCLALHQLGFKATIDKLKTAVKSHIKPGNLGLVFNNFVAIQGDEAAMDDDEVVAESDLSEAFKVFDDDDDEFISTRELQSVLQKLRVPKDKDMDHVELMICFAYNNRDGFKEFWFKKMDFMYRSTRTKIAIATNIKKMAPSRWRNRAVATTYIDMQFSVSQSSPTKLTTIDDENTLLICEATTGKSSQQR